MTNLDKQLEELIKERNDFEAENVALKESLYQTVEFCNTFSEDSFVLFYKGGKVVSYDMMIDKATDLLKGFHDEAS